MATHSDILAWEIPGTKDPGGVQAMGLQMAGHDSEARKQQQWWIIAEHLQTDTNGSSWHVEERVKSEVQQWDATLSTYT